MPTDQPQPSGGGFEANYRRLEIELSAALEEVDAQFVFAQMVQFALIIGANEDNEAEHGTLPSLTEFAAFHLYPRFDKGGSTESDAVERATKAISTLNAQRLMRNMGPDKSDPTAFSEAVRQAQSHSEHVRGSAYPPQTRRKIEGLFGPFYTELKNMTGISPPRVLALLDVFEPTVQNQVEANRKRFHAAQRALSTVGTKQPDGAYKPGPDIDLFWRAANEFEAVLLEAPFTIFVSFAAVRAAISDFGEDEWAALERLCGTSKATRRQMMEPIEVKARPIYFYPDDRFTLLDISSVYDAVFGAYDGIARAEEKLRDRYGHHVADWMEREVETYLLRLFPSANVFRNLDYPDPDKTAATAELDLIVQWGPFVVPIEVKGRQFHIEAQTGNEARLRSDLRSNIAEAFWQARRLIRYLRSVPIGTLKERHSERTVEIEWQKMKRCFPIVVTLEHFGGLATQLATLGDGKWFQAGTYPWAVSLADFDLVTRFCGSPDVLLHYVQRRIQLQESGKNIHGDELDIFGLYLDSRLHPSRFWQRTVDGEEFTMLHLTGGSERFDSWMRAEHDPSASRPEIRLMLPPRLSAAINALRQSGDHEGRWIAVSLLDLSPDATERLEHDIGRIIAAPMPQGQLPRITFPDGDLLVVAMANRGLAPKAFRGLLIERTSREKYRARCERAVGLGFDPRFPGGGFVGAIWIEFPWIQNPELDAALDASKVRIMQEAEGKKPGRNDPCPCGSGKKFKKCCSDRLEFTG